MLKTSIISHHSYFQFDLVQSGILTHILDLRAPLKPKSLKRVLVLKYCYTGRLQGNGGGGGGLLGGGGGGGGGLLGGGGDGGGGGLLGGRRRQQHQDKKQFQMYIPMYLAATTFGWTMVAAKAVGLLTLKALILSKIAFVVAAIVLIKKLMDNASEK